MTDKKIKARLIEGLEIATKQYIRGQHEDKDVDAASRCLPGVLSTISTLRKYCKEIDVPTHCLIPLTAIIREVRDIKSGKNSHLFRTKKISYRPADSSAKKNMHRYTAIAMEILYRDLKQRKEENPRESAAKLVHRRLLKHGIDAGKNWRTIDRWRYDEIGNSNFKSSVSRFSKFGKTSMDAANELIERAVFSLGNNS